MDDPAGLFERRSKKMRSRSRRRYRVHGADFYAGRHDTQRNCLVAVHDHRRLGSRSGGNMEPLLDVLQRPLVTRGEERIVLAHCFLAFAAEAFGDALSNAGLLEVVDGAEQSENPDVLAFTDV